MSISYSILCTGLRWFTTSTAFAIGCQYLSESHPITASCKFFTQFGTLCAFESTTSTAAEEEQQGGFIHYCRIFQFSIVQDVILQSKSLLEWLYYQLLVDIRWKFPARSNQIYFQSKCKMKKQSLPGESYLSSVSCVIIQKTVSSCNRNPETISLEEKKSPSVGRSGRNS